MTRLIVLGSSAAFPLPRTQTNIFEDYFSITKYQKRFPLHTDTICELAKKGGKDSRMRSCIALIHNRHTIFFDAGPDIMYQCKKYRVSPDAVCISHQHLDACYGLRHFSSRVLVYSEHAKTLYPGKAFEVFGITVLPFRVLHSKTVPTVGFQVCVPRKNRSFVFVYAADMASLRGVHNYVHGCDAAFVDGSILKRNLPGHCSIVRQLRYYKQWKVKKVYFTHVGHGTLPHADFQKFVQNRCSRADVAYDGLELKI